MTGARLSEPRLRWHADGTVSIDHGLYNEGFRQAVCALCGEEIRWSLDMFSFTTGAEPHLLAHARCVWTKNAFRTQERLASEES